MTQPSSRPVWPALLLVALLVLLGCGSTSTIVAGGPTAIATAMPTATATPRPPTATPTPGHMLVTIHPIAYGSGKHYVCHTGITCIEHGICTASSWPTFNPSNSGGLSVAWTAMMDGHAAPTTGWTLSATSGTLAGGATTASITVNDNLSTIQTTQPDVVFTAPGQTVRITLVCGIG